jgi:hypothetical protein
MHHHKKTHKRKRGGSFVEDYITGPFGRLTGTTPTPAPQVIDKPTQAATQVVKTSADAANIPSSLSPEGVPGGETPVEKAKLLGGRRRRKTRKHRSRRRH